MRAALALSFLLAHPALAQRPDRVGPALAKADELIEKGDYEGAQQALRAAEQGMAFNDPRRIRVHERRGAIFVRRDKLADAREAFTFAIKGASALDSKDVDKDVLARAYAGMGLCLLKQGNKTYALRFFKKGLELEPDEGTEVFLEDQIAELEGRKPKPLE